MPSLQIGSGEHYCDGWVNVDVWTGFRADVYASVFDLPFQDGEFDRIYMGHFLEHLHLRDIDSAFRELRRVATADCRVGVVGPCYTKAVAGGEPQWLLDAIHITDPIDESPGGHKWTATTENTLALLEEQGLEMTEVHPSYFARPEWPNTCFSEWQCAFVGGWK